MKEVSRADRFPQVNTSEDKDGKALEDEAWPRGSGARPGREQKFSRRCEPGGESVLRRAALTL